MSKMSLSIERLYHPDGKSLGSLVAGLSGSGKTVATISTLQQAIRSPSFGEFHRFIVIDPKTQTGDYDVLADPIWDIEKAFKSIRKNRVTVFYPTVEHIHNDVSSIIDYIFTLADSEPKTSFTFVLDEASIMITPTKIPDAIKRLSLQGRAKRIKPVFISQRPIVNRWTDANMSNLLLFNTLPVDYDTLGKRWGIDFEAHAQEIRDNPYSFLFLNFEKATVNKMNPVPLPLPKPRRKRRWWSMSD